METLQLIGTILGGLGLFLLAISLMTDGLKLAAGPALRSILATWSKTPMRGIMAGYLMTAIVQSSSAVTVASLGFVNAGLMTMRQALGIVYGANVGTTMTGWLVAIVGFKFNIQTFALPLIGIGMLIKMVKPNTRLAYAGMALVGFGLFFIGIDILKLAFEGVVETFDISQFKAEGVGGILTFVLVGAVMTILTQSSSAAIALTITAATSEMVGMYAAGAMVIGANIGTTSTALLATIGATSNAKRVAAAQTIFNLVTAIVALILLPVLFWLIDEITTLLEITANPAISLAIFHTLFNILGVLIVYPHNNRIAGFLEKRFRTWEEKASHPKYIDNTVAQTPVLAVNAILLELLSISDKIIALYNNVIPKRKIPVKQATEQLHVIQALSKEVSNFIVRVEGSALQDKTSTALATLLRIEHYLITCTKSVEHLSNKLDNRQNLMSAHFEDQLLEFFHNTDNFMILARGESDEELPDLNHQFEGLQIQHNALKAELISGATKAQINVEQMSSAIDCIAENLMLAENWCKAFVRLHSLETDIEKENQTEEQEQATIIDAE
ncbi:Na/Pi cotransporter family protein [Thalassotalea sp. LPB0316]|uniref:Na/Pi cotransporter family protein n=1 Tax=Thalassotalea sp. LPB0316 TaxID=2769490 RepID=UPI00186906DC|nr:Na/Pi symporter [Thalassotalea sp. LPB0316]QOL25963.1 Na/Pi cotransporter family protein [Thalassotalea sp. LPB0316]